MTQDPRIMPGKANVELVELSFPKALEDEWAGISNPKERKKIQNRLAQRAYRQRNSRKGNLKIKFFNPSDKNHTADSEAPAKRKTFLNHPVASITTDALPLPIASAGSSNGRVPGAEMDELNILLPKSGLLESTSSRMFTPESGIYTDVLNLHVMRDESEAEPSHQYLELVLEYRDLGVPNDHEFIDLIHYNVFRAFEVITGSLGLTMSLLKQNIPSPFNIVPLGGTVLGDPEEAVSIPPIPDPTPNLPPALKPTQLQFTVPHHPFADLFPSPRLRDNLLRASGSFNDLELCADVMGNGTYDGDASRHSGVIVWGDPWVASGWEVAEHFAQKWSWMLEGCDDLIQSTNYWRAMRGLGNLNLGA